jgi:hypothetical protein
MLSNRYFYYQLTRKYVILFGNMFNNITVKRLNRNVSPPLELERIKVPIIYAPKEKYIARLRSDPDLNREIQVSLPRISFEVVGFTYDPSRKQNSLLKNSSAISSTQANSQYVGVPYDLTFELNIYTRNIDDGTHIVEQILPYFNPDYTITTSMIPEMGFLKDIPLNTVTNDIEHEGNFDAVRFVTWRLTFTVKAHYYGPVTTSGIIRSSNTNIYQDYSLQSGYITRINTCEGNNGTFKIDDIVYQGENYQTATAYGIVSNWSPATGKLTLGATQGQFIANNFIKAIDSNAVYKLCSFDSNPLKLVNINIKPDPIDALPNSAYGYDTTITEWPETEYSQQPSNNQPSADSNLFTVDNNNLTVDTE